MSEKAPAVLGSQGDLSFVDFGMYLIGDRQTMTMDSSPHVKFTSDKTTTAASSGNDGAAVAAVRRHPAQRRADSVAVRADQLDPDVSRRSVPGTLPFRGSARYPKFYQLADRH